MGDENLPLLEEIYADVVLKEVAYHQRDLRLLEKKLSRVVPGYHSRLGRDTLGVEHRWNQTRVLPIETDRTFQVVQKKQLCR